MFDTELIRCEMVEDHIALVTMDAPPVNAQGPQFHADMMTVMDGVSDLDDVRVVVLTGAGRTFSAGADIKSRAGSAAGAPGNAFTVSWNAANP